jgi:hypothetical protein
VHDRAVGYLNSLLYANPTALRDRTQENYDAFNAAVGWDACVEFGSLRATSRQGHGHGRLLWCGLLAASLCPAVVMVT